MLLRKSFKLTQQFNFNDMKLLYKMYRKEGIAIGIAKLICFIVDDPSICLTDIKIPFEELPLYIGRENIIIKWRLMIGK